MEGNRKCIRDLEAMRVSLHQFFRCVLPVLTKDLLKYADDLDKDYKDIKISKIAGQSGCVVGGVLTVVGFGLSFATFGASLGLCIAGVNPATATGCYSNNNKTAIAAAVSRTSDYPGRRALESEGAVIGGAGGVTSGGASIADIVKGKTTKNKAEVELKVCNEAIGKLLEGCKSTSDELERTGDIDRRFPFWCEFWHKFMFGSGRVAAGFGWQMVATTVINAIRLGKTVDMATDVASAVVPVFRTLGNTAKGFHIAGGVVSAVFLPLDVYSLVSNSVELHTSEAHGESKRIRQVVSEMQDKCPKKEEIDDMIDKCIAALEQ